MMAVLDQVARARTFEDLTPDQQRTLDELAVNYRADYDAACDQA